MEKQVIAKHPGLWSGLQLLFSIAVAGVLAVSRITTPAGMMEHEGQKPR